MHTALAEMNVTATSISTCICTRVFVCEFVCMRAVGKGAGAKELGPVSDAQQVAQALHSVGSAHAVSMSPT